MTKVADEKKITVDSVLDDLLGGLVVGVGGVTATVASKVVGGLLPEKAADAKTDYKPLLIAVITIALGVAGRVGSAYIKNKKLKELAKDFSSGFVAAGSIDTAIKTLDMVYPEWRALLPANVEASLPGALGAFNRDWSPNTPVQTFNGIENSNILSGNSNMLADAPYAEVVGSRILN